MNPYDYQDRIEKLHFQATEMKEKYATGVTFSRILRIDRARIRIGSCWRAFEIADSLWAKWRQPDDGPRLCDCLGEILNTCNSLGIPYPGVFLLRQKQLLDGDFIAYRQSLPLLEGENAG